MNGSPLGEQKGQIFLEACLWVFLITVCLLSGSALFQSEYAKYRQAFRASAIVERNFVEN